MCACLRKYMSVSRSNEGEREGASVCARTKGRIKFMLWYAGSEYIHIYMCIYMYVYIYIQGVPGQSRFLPRVQRESRGDRSSRWKIWRFSDARNEQVALRSVWFDKDDRCVKTDTDIRWIYDIFLKLILRINCLRDIYRRNGKCDWPEASLRIRDVERRECKNYLFSLENFSSGKFFNKSFL